MGHQETITKSNTRDDAAFFVAMAFLLGF